MNKIEQAQKECEEVIQWVLKEEEKVVAKLNAEGKYVGGLDGNNADFSYIYQERNRRIEEIKKKYNIT